MVAVEAPAAAANGGLRMLQAGLPIGFRFRPTDEELLLHYLRRKALSFPLPADIIPVADLARLHPWDLPGEADGERYFFYLPATSCWRRGGGGSRAAGTGVWRVSGKEKLVVSPLCNQPVGAKRTLVFCHRGGARTDWAMHEYRLLPSGVHSINPPLHMSCHAPEAKDWVVCRIFKKTTPAHRRSRSIIVRRGADDDMPSSPSSCVTEACHNGGDDGEEEEESSSTIHCSAASNCP
ncbi:hypothetical protein GUJ93_ZPchr0007g5206 [Zizania palustris]|uniref:NAC domain-containing protein n=1 Tax=Zizania palustris TaxID=103762 RepID=A0A8J5SRR2_ZIZPA|nr:hypothetical protein GUJ93_ZPchr0007g5206 [Zizania palustris]